MLLITPTPSHHFSYTGPKTWNTAYKKILTNSNQDLTTTVSLVKNSLKKVLVKNQKRHDENEWIHANFEL